ncbi:MAG: S1C family serine protease, partial [Verrucomicrobiia bacterium]
MTPTSRSERFLAALVCAGVLGLGAVPTNLRGAPGAFEAISKEVQAVFELASPAVVKVRAFSGTTPLAGTGFFIDAHGTILTAYAVVRDANRAWIERDGEKIEAQILGRDPRSGIALLKVDLGTTPFLRFGDPGQLKVASALVSVAYPFNMEAAPSFGLVTGFNAVYASPTLNQFFATTHIRASLDVQPGQVGGPVMNGKGEVMGILMVATQDQRECFILPSNAALKIVRDIEQYGQARHGWVGVGVTTDQGVVAAVNPVAVSTLYENTPAASSGILPGDRVLSVGDRPIRQPSDVLDVAFFSKVGEVLPVKVERGGETRVFEIQVIDRPAEVRMVDFRKI